LRIVVGSIEQQVHGYRGGHQLLASSVALVREDQDLVDRLSDLSGPLTAGQDFAPYLTSYPLPSGRYYVIARTWQDKAAVRAGCVLTRSLLVPMQDWLDAPSLGFLLDALRPVDKAKPEAASLTAGIETASLPVVTDLRAGELVEALFLETRQPIVMFEVMDADLIIARLLTALWPGMRRQFATCGMALAPRSLEGRPFDFLCAPKSSRLRFAEWPGRKIDESASRTARHRWTPQAADQIFQAAIPNLSTFDALGILRTDMHGDGSILRIALLWNELLEKAQTSPNAALGLLDILASQDSFAAAPSLLPLLSHAVDLSRHDNTAFEHLRYLVTLLGKFAGRQMPLSLLRHIRQSASAVAAHEPAQTVEFLASADSLGRRLSRTFCAGLGDGLAKTADTIVIGAFDRLAPETQLTLLSASTPLDERLLGAGPGAGPTWPENIRRAMEATSVQLRLRAAGRLVPNLRHKSQGPILRGVLHGATWPLIARTLDQLWRGCQFEIAEFAEAILRAAAHVHAVPNLRRLLANYPETSATDRFLASTLQLSGPDIEWLLTSAELSTARATDLLCRLIAGSDEFALERAFADPVLKLQVLYRIGRGETVDGASIARILLVTGIGSQQEFELGLVAFNQAQRPSQYPGLARLLLQAFFRYAAELDGRVQQDLLVAIGKQLEGSDIVFAATDETFSADQLNDNIRLLNAAAPSLRLAILGKIDQLSDRIINFRGSYFDNEAIRAWASLIASSGAVDPRAQLRAAETALPFALKMVRGPASPLIVVVFPLVHAALAGADSTTPSILSFFFFFGDYWDRCDVLRRGLVDAFMQSDWPPADLFLAAHAADVIDEVLDIVSLRHGGKDYLKAIRKDLKRLPDDMQSALQDKLGQKRRL
jgi:hypothetical protein